jgi:hypothetical protein
MFPCYLKFIRLTGQFLCSLEPSPDIPQPPLVPFPGDSPSTPNALPRQVKWEESRMRCWGYNHYPVLIKCKKYHLGPFVEYRSTSMKVSKTRLDSCNDMRRLKMAFLIPYPPPPGVGTCHLQGFTPYGIRFSHKTYRPSPTTDVTWKDPPYIRGPLIGGVYCIWDPIMVPLPPPHIQTPRFDNKYMSVSG